MAAKKKVQASDVEVGNRTLEGVLADTAEQIKDNNARMDATNARIDKTIEEVKALRLESEKRWAEQEAAKREADARHEVIANELRRLHDVTMNELRTVAAALMTFAGKTDERLRKLEDKAA
jgi:hypothetical protein